VTEKLAERVGLLEAVVEDLVAREAIREVVYDYQRLCDGGWAGPSHADPVALAALFTDDGEYQIDPTRPPNSGRSTITEAFIRLQKSMPWIIHYATNPIIVRDGTEAKVRVQGFALYRREGADHLATGTYNGTLRYDDGFWRFTSWIFTLAHSRTL
jgi:hypothetical protein